MNQVLSIVQAARVSASNGTVLSSESMLLALVALHEEMLSQLRLEQPDGISTVDFLERMIVQHENAAAMLREQLEPHGADKSPALYRLQPSS